MDLGIRNRAAIVTGGSRGIGLQTARVLLEAGARVAICGSVGEWSASRAVGHRPLAEHMRAGLRRVARRAYPRWGMLVSRP